MKLLHRGLLAAALLGACLTGLTSPASAQSSVRPMPKVVATCGTPPYTYTAGNYEFALQDQNGNQCISGTISATNPSVGTNGAANPASSTQVGVSDGTNLQKVVAPIGLGDGVNGNNMVSTGGWVWNGTTWDRAAGTAAGGAKVTVAGAVAQGSTTAGQTVQPIGCRTLSSLPTDTTAQTNMPACTTSGELSTHDATLATLAAEGVGNTAASVPSQAIYMGCRGTTSSPTAVTDGQLVGPMCSKTGKVISEPFAPSDLKVRGKASGTDTSAHTIIAAGAGSLKNYITGVQCGRTDAGTSPIVVTFSDDQSTPMVIPDAGNGGGNNFNFNASPIVTAAATAFTFTSGTGVTTLYCSAQGYQAP